SRSVIRRPDSLPQRASSAGSAGCRARPPPAGSWSCQGVLGGQRRRLIQRQREAERAATQRQLFRPDAPAMQPDDRAADGEPEAHAARLCLWRAVLELREHALDIAWRQPGPEVLDRYHEL